MKKLNNNDLGYGNCSECGKPIGYWSIRYLDDWSLACPDCYFYLKSKNLQGDELDQFSNYCLAMDSGSVPGSRTGKH